MPGSKNPLGSLAFGRFQNKAVGLNLNSLPGCGEWGGQCPIWGGDISHGAP